MRSLKRSHCSQSAGAINPAPLIPTGLEPRRIYQFSSSHVHVNMHATVGQSMSDKHVQPGYLQPSGGLVFCGLWQFGCFSFTVVIQTRVCS